MVGDEGAMFRVAPDGTASTYPLDIEQDLLAIACVGSDVAWVAGRGGVVLTTGDAGNTWSPVPVPSAQDLTGVAVAEASGQVVLVGGGGTVLLRERPGDPFQPVFGASGTLTAVALDPQAATVVATGDDGSIWSAGGGVVRRVTRVDAPLRGVSVSADGRDVVVVGDGGAAYWSDDAGVSFEPLPTGTARDLYAVHLAADGGSFTAVGAAGVLVRWDGIEAWSEERLDPALSLRAVHLAASGAGQAVGDEGVSLTTLDGGLSWERAVVAAGVTLRGVDDLHAGAHQ